MQLVDVSFIPELTPVKHLSDRTVVIVDILRASSTWVTALYHGAESIMPFESIEGCLAMKEKGCIIAAERGGEKVPGFDLGNSPFEFQDVRIKGKRIAVTTTNGTKTVLSAKGSYDTIIGSFLNFTATSEYLQKEGKVQIICAGWEGQPGALGQSHTHGPSQNLCRARHKNAQQEHRLLPQNDRRPHHVRRSSN